MIEEKSKDKSRIRIKHCPYCGAEGVVPISQNFNEKEKEIIEFIVYLRYRHYTPVKYCPICKKCYVVFGVGTDTIERVKKGDYDGRWSFLFEE
jgi:uncharacterized protein with PIN domain